MHIIVLHISIYLFSWLHVLCDLCLINNDRNHAILAIFISVFFWDISFCWVVFLNMCSYAHNASMKMTLMCLGCQYTDFYSQLFCYMLMEIILEFRHEFN